MALRIDTMTVPLETTADGVVRVRGTRIPLDTVVTAFHLGATPEEIAQQYSPLDLADIYAGTGLQRGEPSGRVGIVDDGGS